MTFVPQHESPEHPATDACPSVAAPSSHTSQVLTFTIYGLRHSASGMHYVGLTSRHLGARVSAHVYQARRSGGVRPGGLMDAIRKAEVSGQSFQATFQVFTLATTESRSEAQALEAQWINALQARRPTGYNLMPAGGVGGPSNSRPIRVSLATGDALEVPTIGHAIRISNAERQSADLPPLSAAAYYARLCSGWSPDQAFGAAPRLDGRSVRAAVRVGSGEYVSLREASESTGISIGALRSRLHRAGGAEADIGQDRRSQPGPSTDIAITWPDTKEAVTAAEFARRSGIPKATVISRRHQAIRLGFDPADVDDLFEWITTGQDRRRVIRLALPDGDVWVGGYRELARRLLGHPKWEALRSRRLGESGIRRRLRRLDDAKLDDPGHVQWAFGFEPPTANLKPSVSL